MTATEPGESSAELVRGGKATGGRDTIYLLESHWQTFSHLANESKMEEGGGRGYDRIGNVEMHNDATAKVTNRHC